MLIMSDSDPPAKRVKLDTEVSATSDAPVAPPAAVPAPAALAKPQFSFEGETGLFATVAPTLGVRAATEDEVGISEYADATVPPFSGIIKHR